jgi:hypothetical protein
VTLARLDAWRRRLPLVWWLVYDAIVAVVILAGVAPSDPLFILGLGWLFVAAIIDAVEFLAKRRAARVAAAQAELHERFSEVVASGRWAMQTEKR